MTCCQTARVHALTTALIAVQARVVGDWDNAALKGRSITTSTMDDVHAIVEEALGAQWPVEIGVPV